MGWNANTFLGGIVNAGRWVTSLFSPSEKLILEFFQPLIKQVRDEALVLGKNDLNEGLRILKDAALAAAMAGALAPPGTKVAVAEAMFLKVGASEGITAIHNAEAAAIKAAAAIVQQERAAVAKTANTVTAETAPPPSTPPPTDPGVTPA